MVDDFNGATWDRESQRRRQQPRQSGLAVCSAAMDPLVIQQIRHAVDADDWILAADICLEIILSAQDELHRLRAEDLAKAVRLQDAPAVEAIIAQLEV